MSKAYDSININMLTKAMARIFIPSQIINILLALNQERNNQVITAHGLTESYPVIGGIDQGDTISPLLWRIYYDPLLSKVSKQHKGYVFTNKPEVSLHKHNQHSLTINTIAYMDDTTWIIFSKA